MWHRNVRAPLPVPGCSQGNSQSLRVADDQARRSGRKQTRLRKTGRAPMSDTTEQFIDEQACGIHVEVLSTLARDSSASWGCRQDAARRQPCFNVEL